MLAVVFLLQHGDPNAVGDRKNLLAQQPVDLLQSLERRIGVAQRLLRRMQPLPEVLAFSRVLAVCLAQHIELVVSQFNCNRA